MDGAQRAAPSSVHDQDFCAWAVEQAALLRAGRLSDADIENLAEEIEDLARRARRELMSRLQVLIAHLLKWDVQPELRGRSWASSIHTHRAQVRAILDENPSLAARYDEFLAAAWPKACEAAAIDTGLGAERFRLVTPWAREHVLDDAFLPG